MVLLVINDLMGIEVVSLALIDVNCPKWQIGLDTNKKGGREAVIKYT